jgi:UDP-3-O-[3-hydroxymyristoyl] glucosamine N-acyltransferase
MLITQLAKFLDASVVYAGQNLNTLEITGVAGMAQAQPGDLTFLGSPAFASLVGGTQASALITREPLSDFHGPQLIHKDPHYAYAKAASLYHKVNHGPPGIHPTAVIEDGVILGENVTIGAYTYIGQGTVIRDRTVLYPHVYVGQNVEIESDTVIHSQSVIYFGCKIGQRCLFHAGCIIGADGFGFAVSGGEICKIPQQGIVVIEDDVECGAGVTVDRAANGETRVKKGCKFDDKVHIGHNVEVGENCMFSALSAVAGSTRIGNWVLMGGHSGISDHLNVATGTRIGAKTGVIQNIDHAGTYVGFPAEPIQDWKRSVIYLRHFRKYIQQIRDLEKRLLKLENMEVESHEAPSHHEDRSSREV